MKSKEPRKPNLLLREQRLLRGWSLQRVVDELCALSSASDERLPGVNTIMVSNWETGTKKPSPFYRERLCKLYDMSADQLGFMEQRVLPYPGRSNRAAPKTTASNEHYPTQPIHPLQPLGIPISAQTAGIIPREQIKAIDLLSDGTEHTLDEQMAAWLVLSAQNLTPLFDAGWTPHMALEALHALLPGVQAMSAISRRAFGQHLLQLGAAAFLSGVAVPTGKLVSAEERIHLQRTLGESIAAGWKLFHTAGNAQVLAVGRAELVLIQQAHALLYPQVRSIFYIGVYNLIGRAYHLQENYEEALQAHTSAHIAALGTGDPLHVAQSLICQADTYQALGQHASAIQCIEEALRTLGHYDEEHVRSRAHLLGCWADNAMTMQEFAFAEHKLHEAEPYLDYISQKEEFDRASWLQLAGKRAIMAGKYKQAVSYLEEASAINPPHWLVRHAGILIPLAIAHARMGERDLSVEIARQAIPVLVNLNAPMSNRHFADYLQQDLLQLFPQDEQIHTFVAEAQRQLPQITAFTG